MTLISAAFDIVMKHRLILLAHQLDWKPGTFSWRGSRFLPLTSLGWMGRETLKTLILSLQLSRCNSLPMTSKSVSPPYPHWPTLSMQLAGLTDWIVSSYCIILADWLAGCGESVIICGVVLIVMLFVLQDVELLPSCSQTCECVTGLMTYPSSCYGLPAHLCLPSLLHRPHSYYYYADVQLTCLSACLQYSSSCHANHFILVLHFFDLSKVIHGKNILLANWTPGIPLKVYQKAEHV